MIVANRKPLEEILDSIKGAEKVLVAGCGTCVAVCMAGGEKEVQYLAAELRMAAKLRGMKLEVSEATALRQCDKEFLETLRENQQGKDAVISMACGIGVQFLALNYEPMRVVPAVNTVFMGANLGMGQWSEYCLSCGNCVLAETGGICPIARCSKNLLNGPCGGSSKGKCEISPETDCVWQLIYDRIKTLGRLDELSEIKAPKDWKTSRDGGPRRIDRKDMQI